MSEGELMAIIAGEIDRAKDYTLGVIGKERATAYDYYYGRPFGNEEAGRSKVISHDVAQQIDSAIPALMKIFSGSDKAVEFTARKAEDVKAAEQATELCNYIFYTQNNGFMLLHDAIKNALLQKTGVFKWYWDESTSVSEETYEGLSEELVAMVSADPMMEIIGQSMVQEVGLDGVPVPKYDIKVRKKTKAGKAKVCVVPPDELLVGDNAYGMDADEIPVITHRSEKTLSELVAMGYDEETVLGLSSEESDYSQEDESRRARVGDWQGKSHDIPDPMLRKVWYDETYIKIDFDRDGIAERRKVCSVGMVPLHNEVIDAVPLSFGTTKIMPHEFYGVSMADEVMDLQLLKSALWRQSMDNIYLANTPRTVVDTTRITNLDDVMTVRMGGVIRSNGPANGAVEAIATPFVAQHTFPMIEYIDAEEETRTGVSRLMQGVDPNSLNKTATGVNALMNASQARLELVARGLAETLIKPMFRGLMKLTAQHQHEALTLRLRNEYVPVDPRTWQSDYDMTVNVGLGTGTKDQQAQHLTNIIGLQGQIAQMLQGMVGPDVLYTKFFNAAGKLVETAGFKDPSQFFPDPKELQPPQPQKPPEIQKAEMQIQADQQKAQAEMQMEGQKMQMEQVFKEREQQFEERMKEREAQFEMQLETWKAQMEMQMKERLGMMNAMANANRPQPEGASQR